MTKQTVAIGAAANDGTGDPARSAFTKINANFNEIYNFVTGATNGTTIPAALPLAKGGTGATTAEAARTNLGLGSAATVGLGSSGAGMAVSSTAGQIADFNRLNSNYAGFFQGIGSSGVNFPTAEANMMYSTIINGRRSESAGFCIFSNTSVSPRIVAYAFTNNTYRQCKLYTSTNTATDANGFIKAASPIVNLFSDHIETNDEAQQQDIIFEKLGVGDYLIKNSSGFAQDGWYVEMPKDANGNVLVAVIYEQLENNDISVKTYKKKFDLETVSIVADLDNPVDIPDGRWIDLRLQELPQPEIEDEEISNTPADFQPTNLAQAVQEMMSNGAEQ